MLLEKIKLSMRISHGALDDDIQGNIDACIIDLNNAGIKVSEMDALLQKAVEIYCKWQYDYCGKGDDFKAAYENLKITLSMVGDYIAE